MRKLFVFAAVAVCACAQSSYLTVTSSNLKDASGNPANGKITFAPHSAVKLAGQGQVTTRAVTATVSNGAFSLSVADTTKTTPASCYDVYATDSLNRLYLGDPSINVATGYQCVTTTSSWCASGTCNFDNYIPDSTAALVTGGGGGTGTTTGGTASSNVLYTVATLPSASAQPQGAGSSSVIAWVGDGGNSTDCTTGGGNFLVACVPAGSTWMARTTGAVPFTQQFASQTSVTLNHNLNSLNVITACYNNASNQITPGSITVTDANNVTVNFLSAQTGRCVVNAGGGGTGSTGLSGSNYSFAFTAQTNLSLTHNLNTRNVLMQCFDSSDDYLLPGSWTITDANHLSVQFASAATGRCIVNTGGGFGGSGATGGSGSGTAVVNAYIDASSKNIVGDGVTDNLSAINTTLAQMAANANGQNHRLYFPPGTYVISDTVVVPTKTEVYGNGVGDISVGGTTFIQSSSFPSGHPMFQYGVNSTGLVMRSSVHDMNIACQSNTGVAIYGFNAQEQTSSHHLVIFGCGDTGLRIKGTNSCGGVGGCTGYSEHNGPDHDMEIYPDRWGSATTTCFDIADDQNYHGIENITCAMGSYLSTKPNYGGKLGCSGCSAHGLHFENAHNGVALGPSATQGISGALIYDVDGTTGVDGNIIEIEANTHNSPYDLHMYGVSGGAVPIKNLAYPLYGDCYTSMDMGQQNGGNLTVHCGDFASTYNIYDHLQLWRGMDSQIAGQLWCNKYNGGSFPNYCLNAVLDTNGNEMFVFGTNASGGGDTLFNNPFQALALSGSNTENGLNLCGACGDSNNGFQSLISTNLRYNHATGKLILPGNNSGAASGIAAQDPGGAVPVRSGLGGLTFFSQSGLTEGGTGYSGTQFNSWSAFMAPSTGGLMLFGEYKSRPTCTATTRELLWFNFDNTNTADSLSYCGYAGGTLAWQGFGSGGGGSSGNATQIQGNNVSSTSPSDTAVLQWSATSSTYVPTVLPHISATGCGASVTGSTTLSINSLRTPDTAQPTTIPPTDGCGSPVFYSSVTSVALPQPGVGANFVAGAWFQIFNNTGSNQTITPSSATIAVNGAAAAGSYTLATGHNLTVFSNGTNYVAQSQ